MSKESRNRGGRPKGLPKTGGRKKGTPNKNNLRLRYRFEEQGFDFTSEMIQGLARLKEKDPVMHMEALVKLTPFFMQRLRQEEEAQGEALGALAAGGEIPSEKEISTEDLLKLVKGEK